MPDPPPPDRLADVRASYDAAARAYAEHVAGELAHKPLDRHLLNRFAEEVRGRGIVADVGCGPGHVAAYLHAQGAEVVGIDLSPEMVRCARELHPGLDFRTGDFTALELATGSLAGAVAFYAIVHLDPPELAPVMAELRRVVAPGGIVLVAFHAGGERLHVDELFGQAVSLDFRFHTPADVERALRAAGFAVTERVEREPYPGVEYPSRRCYLLARAE